MPNNNKKAAKKKLKTILIVFLVLLSFATVTFITIIYTQGGRFTSGGIVETGSLKIEVSPSNTSPKAYIDDKPYRIEQGFIYGIKPGEYKLRIESENFHPWQKSFIIRPGLVSSIEVNLFPIDSELTQLTKTDIDKVFFTRDGRFAYFTVTNPELSEQDRGLFRIALESQSSFFNRDPETEKLSSINDEIFTLLANDNLSITPASNGSKLLITNNIDSTYIYDLLESNPNQRIIDINKLLKFSPRSVSFINNNNSLLVEDEGILFELNLNNNEKTIVDYSKNRPTIFASNSIDTYLYLPEENQIFNYKNKGLLSLEIPSNLLPSGISSIKVDDNAKSFLIEANNTFYFLDIDTFVLKEILSNAKLLDISYDGSSLIFEKDNSIILSTIERIIAQDEISIETFQTEIPISSAPKFIYQSNLISYNDSFSNKLSIVLNDGTNPLYLIEDKEITNGYYSFQPAGNSLTALIELKDDQENDLIRNLYRVTFNNNSIPFIGN